MSRITKIIFAWLTLIVFIVSMWSVPVLAEAEVTDGETAVTGEADTDTTSDTGTGTDTGDTGTATDASDTGTGSDTGDTGTSGEGDGEANQEEFKGAGVQYEDILKDKSFIQDDTYDYYINQYPEDAKKPDETIVIKPDQYTKAEAEVEIYTDYKGSKGKSLFMGDEGYVEYKVNVKTAGFYNIKVTYFPIEGKGSTIERGFTINGKVPFYDATRMMFQRVWADLDERDTLSEKEVAVMREGTPFRRDNRDNEIRPKQVESPIWQTAYLKDTLGYYTEPYYFYFESGENTLRLDSVKEPMVIGEITLCQQPVIPTYEEVLATYQANGYKDVSGFFDELPAEVPTYKSDPTLYAKYDRSSPATVPYSPSKIRMNIIGGTTWNTPRQWISWEMDVPEDGLYTINLKYRQNVSRGAYTVRQLFIDDQVPFKEAEFLKFPYTNDWTNMTIGDGTNPYKFYLTKGKHYLKLEASLGDLASLVREAEVSVNFLNVSYMKILIITGPTPDQYRDYMLDTKLPGVILVFEHESQRLAEMSKAVEALTGNKGDKVATLDRFSYQLANLVKKSDTIHTRMDAIKQNIGALSTWMLNMSSQPVEFDTITVLSDDKIPDLPTPEAGFFRKVGHELSSFVASFTEDYNSIGNTYTGKDAQTIKVWITLGRDQANVLKELIDDTFVAQSGINVNLQLVQANVLLPSIVAGMGPDVVMSTGNGEAVNYALRGAVTDVSKFSGFSEVEKRFNPSAITPLRFNGGVYGVPETENFSMLFYRTDILKDMGIKVPSTWEDVIAIIPELQKNNMSFGIPTQNLATFGTYQMFLYQNGGSLYNEDATRTMLDGSEAIYSFKLWTDFFRNYKLPVEYDFANRFRIGEMPMAIADYGMYNTLAVFAPEIRGKWDFALIPGTVKEDGTIDRSVASGGLVSMILESSKNKEASWEFVKWWTDTDAQVRFGRGMESLMGASARYATANQEAFSMLAWPTKDYKLLREQWDWVKGVPQVPGGYFTSRHLENAFRTVINQNEDQRETLLDYVRVINEEITNKRKEFGLTYIEAE